jgi:hypothetical protein
MPIIGASKTNSVVSANDLKPAMVIFDNRMKRKTSCLMYWLHPEAVFYPNKRVQGVPHTSENGCKAK